MPASYEYQTIAWQLLSHGKTFISNDKGIKLWLALTFDNFSIAAAQGIVLLDSFEIRIGMDPTDFTNNILCHNKTDGIIRGNTTNIRCDNVSRGQYLSIQKHTAGYLQLCEVQVIPYSE